MGTSATESCEGYLQAQFKDLPPQITLQLSLVRLRRQGSNTGVVKVKSFLFTYIQEIALL